MEGEGGVRRGKERWRKKNKKRMGGKIGNFARAAPGRGGGVREWEGKKPNSPNTPVCPLINRQKVL